MQHAREFILGFLLSVASWETWENIFVSLTIALVGGFMAAMGKAIHNRVYNHFNQRKTQNEPDSNR